MGGGVLCFVEGLVLQRVVRVDLYGFGGDRHHDEQIGSFGCSNFYL
jgi:hypothetical protein